MKKTIVVFLTLVLLLTQLTSMTYPTETDSSSVSNDVVVSASERSPYEKIHVYTHPDDENDYSLICNVEELSTAVQALKIYTASLTPEKALQNEQSDIRITVEFESHFSETKEYISFQKRFDSAKSIEEVRQVRQELNSFSKEYHSAVIKSNLPLLNTLSYTQIDEIGYSPFVVIDAPIETVTSADLLSLASNHTVTNISLESTLDLTELEFAEDTHTTTSVLTSTDYGNERAALWGEMLTCIGAKSIVDTGVFKGEGIIIGVLDRQVCDITNENLYDKDIINISGSTTTKEHATNVTSIIALIAPEATIVCDKRRANISIESFISYNCDIVNISQNFGYNTSYSPTVDGIIDYQAYNHWVTVVKSAGNLGLVSDNVSSPGRGYNVITVGGVTLTDTDHIIHDPESAYNKYDNSAKPNICGVYDLWIPNNAYGNISDYGTSYAAPQVTACIALLLEINIVNYNRWLTPVMVMSLILSGAEKTDDYTPISLGLIQFDRRVGAGLFNLNNCIQNSTFVTQWYTFYADENEVIYQSQIHLEAGQTIQVALSLFVPMTYLTDAIGSAGNPNEFVDYDLFLYSISNQTSVSFSVLSVESNNELLRYTAYQSGDFYIQVKARDEQYNLMQWLSLAYRIET